MWLCFIHIYHYLRLKLYKTKFLAKDDCSKPEVLTLWRLALPLGESGNRLKKDGKRFQIKKQKYSLYMRIIQTI